MDHSLQINVPFPSERHATIAMRVLDVDKELKATQVQRTLETAGSVLKVMLRVSTNSFFDMLIMVTRTMDQFDITQ